MGTQINGSVLKAFEILNMFSNNRREITTPDVARELRVNNVTANRFLRTLEETGALNTKSKGVYRLGYLFVHLAEQVTCHENLSSIMHPALEKVTNELKEASMLTVFERDMVRVIDIVNPFSTQSLTVNVRKGTQLEAYCTSQGKIWLANLSDRQLDRYLKKVRLKPFTSRTITDPECLKKEINQVREQGFAISQEEKEQGLVTVAVPIKTQNDKMIAGISVFAPAARMSEQFIKIAIAHLKVVSKEFQKSLSI